MTPVNGDENMANCEVDVPTRLFRVLAYAFGKLACMCSRDHRRSITGP